MDGVNGLCPDGIDGAVLSGVEASAGRCGGTLHGFARGWLRAYHPDHRLTLGSANVGDMVGLGCTADVNVDLIVSLHWLYGAG